MISECSNTDDPHSRSLCISVSISFFINLLYTVFVSLQIFEIYKLFHRIYKKKIFLFALIFFQIVFNSASLVYNLANIFLVSDIALRHIIFIFLTYIFLKKFFKITKNEYLSSRLKMIQIIYSITVFMSASIMLVFGFYYNFDETYCSKPFWFGIRALGIIITTGFIAICVFLIKKFLHTVDQVHKEFMNFFGCANEIDPKILKSHLLNVLRSEEKIYDLIRIMVYYFVSAFLTICITFYDSFNHIQGASCAEHNFIFKSDVVLDSSFEIILAWVLNIFNYHMPILIVFYVFQGEKKEIEKRNFNVFIERFTQSDNFINNLRIGRLGAEKETN